MASVVLVDPRGWQGFATGHSAYPNVGIAYLSSALRVRGHEAHIIDLNNSLMSEEEVLSDLSRRTPDLIGFSIKTATMRSAERLAAMVKTAFPDVPIVAGGPHITLTYETLLDHPSFDYLMPGEGEKSFPDACDHLIRGGPVATMPGVIRTRVEGGGPHHVPMVEDPDGLEFPTYGGFPQPVQARLKRRYPLLTSRGCPYRCIFCSVPFVSGRKFRVRSYDNLIQELVQAIEKGATGFEIIDDVFNLNVRRSKEFCRRLIDAALGLEWCCENGIRADRMDKELAHLMYRSGCRHVCVGVESADPPVFANVKKGETLEEIKDGIRMLKDAGVEISGFFIIGLPGSSPASEERAVEFAYRLGITPVFNMLVPYPGTPLYGWARDNARFVADIEEGVHFHEGVVRTVIETEDYLAKERVAAWERVHFRIASLRSLLGRDTPLWIKLFRFMRFSWRYNLFKALPFLQRKVRRKLRRFIPRHLTSRVE
ncbi:MAG: B12-binding domain-containing radical SAM protein [Candidatus Methylomirabilales bacterium]